MMGGGVSRAPVSGATGAVSSPVASGASTTRETAEQGSGPLAKRPRLDERPAPQHGQRTREHIVVDSAPSYPPRRPSIEPASASFTAGEPTRPLPTRCARTPRAHGTVAAVPFLADTRTCTCAPRQRRRRLCRPARHAPPRPSLPPPPPPSLPRRRRTPPPQASWGSLAGSRARMTRRRSSRPHQQSPQPCRWLPSPPPRPQPPPSQPQRQRRRRRAASAIVSICSGSCRMHSTAA